MSKEVLQSFYSSLASKDAAGMIQHYHEDVLFQDPAFGPLEGAKAGAMWQMLMDSRKDKLFEVRFEILEAAADYGKVKWDARYDFTKTGRIIHNHITAELTLVDGKIIEHIDTFNLHRWAGQAYGPTGWLMGWTPFFKRKIRSVTGHMLERYMEKT